jgi:hypothetical protein
MTKEVTNLSNQQATAMLLRTNPAKPKRTNNEKEQIWSEVSQT